MQTTELQRAVFLALKHSIEDNDCWAAFLKEWDGFMSAIIRRKLFFNASIWEDALLEAEVKIFRFIGKFDESRNISPWLARVVTSACEDVKKSYGYDLKSRPLESPDNSARSGKKESQGGGTDIEFDEDWINAIGIAQASDNEMSGDMWCCINAALEDLDIDERKITAFLLFYRYDYKLREIAKILHLKQSTVNNWPGSVLKQIMPQVKRELRGLGYATDTADAK